MIDLLEKRLPSLLASTSSVYGPDAYLFGVDLGQEDFGKLCDEIDFRPYDRREPLLWDGIKITPSNSLGPGEINAVVVVPKNLIVRLIKL